MPFPTMSLSRSSAASWKEMRTEEKSVERDGRLVHRKPFPQAGVAERGGDAGGAERVLGKLRMGWWSEDGGGREFIGTGW